MKSPPIDNSSAPDSFVLTLICPDGRIPAGLADEIRSWGAEVTREAPMSEAGHTPRAVEYHLRFSDGPLPATDALRAYGQERGIDVALMPTSLRHGRRRLVAFDMDSTLIQCEVIDELAARAGAGEAVAAVTARAMRGEIDFKASFRERMAKLRGLEETALEAVARDLPVMPGAPRLLQRLRELGHYTVILSGGFDYFARRLQERLGVDEVHANTLHIEHGALSGAVIGEIVDGSRKVELLRRIAAEQGIAMEDTVAVGDGANDLPMLAASGMGVAFHAKPLVKEQAPYAVSNSDLDALLYLLGDSRG